MMLGEKFKKYTQESDGDMIEEHQSLKTTTVNI
jgi:hypothetical protein